MSRIPRRRFCAIALILGLLVTTLGLVGCSSSSPAPTKNGQTGDLSRDTAAGAAPGAQAPETPSTQETGSSGEDPAHRDVPATERSIIYIGSITLRVSNINDSATKASTIAKNAAGFVSGDERTIDAKKSQATLVLRIPATRFSAVLDDLQRSLGKELDRRVQAEDVTEQIIDIDARVATAQASVDRVRALMVKAQTISEIVSLESELSRREANLNSLLRRKAKLADSTSLSTITVTMLGPDARRDHTDDRGFLHGLSKGWEAFLSSAVVLVTIFGILLPWIVAIGLPPFLAVVVIRRLRRRRVVHHEHLTDQDGS